MKKNERFLDILGQTSPFPFLIEVDRAEGIYFFDKAGKSYMDMISGVSVNNIGHRHPKVTERLHQQIDKYLHVMVYGEFVQDAQMEMAERLLAFLPDNLNSVYPVNSGTEANEAAIKLAKRTTGRYEIISFEGSYHGNTQGSMSVSANEYKKTAYRPLIPGVRFIRHNNTEDLKWITEKTAGVILETVQGDAGVRVPSIDFMKSLRNRCNEVGALLIFDEVQCGMGRTGKLFAFEHFGVTPDVLTLGKALGGGMPIGAFITSKEKMLELSYDPILGHITTFGGHPVVCAASAGCLQVFDEEIDFEEVERKGAVLQGLLNAHPAITESRRIGMMFAFDMESADKVNQLVMKCLESGLLSFWFLSNPHSFRLSPPLTISEEEIRKAASIILDALDTIK